MPVLDDAHASSSSPQPPVSPRTAIALRYKMRRIQNRTLDQGRLPVPILENGVLDDPDVYLEEPNVVWEEATLSSIGHVSLSIENTMTAKKLAEDDDKTRDDPAPATSEDASDDDEQDGDATMDPRMVVGCINDTIIRSGHLPDLFQRIERDPNLFVTTIMDGRINSIAGIPSDASNTLIFSTVNLFRNESLLLKVLGPALDRELADIHASADLFRKNTQVTRMLTLCARAFGQNIHAQVLAVLRKIIASSEAVSFEIDPQVETSAKQRRANLKALCNASADLLRAVVADVPTTFTVMCRVVHSAIERKFEGSGWVGMSNLLFLRFVCPTIVAPFPNESKPMTKQCKRNLILVAKVVQSAASLHEFGDKEEFMQALNPLIRKVIPQLTTFYDLFKDPNPKHTRTHSDVDRMSKALRVDVRSYVVTRKISSLARIAEYLELLSHFPDALTKTGGCLESDNVKYGRRSYRAILSVLHDSVFLYKAAAANPSLNVPSAEIRVEDIDAVAVSSASPTTIEIVMSDASVHRLQYADDVTCQTWIARLRDHKAVVNDMKADWKQHDI
ncbi:Ras-GAP domain-containing protein [Plasmodiophora brassicae]